MAEARDNEIDWDKLDRYVRGDGNRDERAKLEQWINEDPDRLALVKAMRAVGARGSTEPDTDRAWRAMQSKLPGARPVTPSRTSAPVAQRPATPAWRRAAPLAAAIVLLAVAVPLIQRAANRRTPLALPPKELTTGPGQRASFQLADGSTVQLSPSSKLIVPGDLGSRAKARREVILEGEGFFTVTHDSARPFAVKTAHGTAEDLGTVFAVNVYPEIRGMRLAVREGRVAIHPTTIPADTSTSGGLVAILEAGDVARVDSQGGMSIVRRQEMGPLFAGAEGSLVLRDVALRDARPMLERWFDIQIRVDEPTLLARKVSGTFRDESPQAALSVIALVLERRAVWTGKEVRLQ